MRTIINLSVIILALAAWAAAHPTIQDTDKLEAMVKGPFPSLRDRPSCYGVTHLLNLPLIVRALNLHGARSHFA
jgi:hypothetical protein